MSSTRPLTDSRSRPSSPLISVNGITKSFSNTLANSNIKLNLNNGEIHALLGENGAGKSTLVKIIYGLIAPDSGEMKLSGQLFQPKNPRDARKNGIGMVFQHFSLFESLTVLENIILGAEDGNLISQSLSTARQSPNALAKEYELNVDPDSLIENINVGMQQRVEILKALYRKAKILILDEPTAGVDVELRHELWDYLKELHNNGKTILLTTHYIEEAELLLSLIHI